MRLFHYILFAIFIVVGLLFYTYFWKPASENVRFVKKSARAHHLVTNAIEGLSPVDVHELMEQIGPCGQWTDLQSISEIPKNIIPTEEAGYFIKFCSETPFLLDEKKLNQSVLGLLVISIEDGNLSNEVGAEKITSYQPTNGMDSRGDLVVGLWDKPTFSSSNYSNVGLHSKSE